MAVPSDWNNHDAWNLHFKEEIVDLSKIPKYRIRDYLRYFSACEDKKVWISGCGLELTPWLFSNLGCELLATDISEIAIEFQKQLCGKNPFKELENFTEILKKLEITTERKVVPSQLRVADFRTTNTTEQFDIILNRRAIQGLSKVDIEAAATNFFKSTKNGGAFVASTMNVQGERRTLIENAFLKAGFFIPNVEAEQWYRKKLDDTGILYVMVLGFPQVPRWGQYKPENRVEFEERDRAILRSFMQEYQERLKANYEKDITTFKPEIDKRAYIIYNTG